MKNLLRTIISSFFLAIILFACTEDYFEFDKIKTDDWRPELALPLINSSLTLGDIILKSDTTGIVNTNSNGNIEVVYKSSVISTDGNRVYIVPTQTFGEKFDTPIPALNLGINFPIDTTLDLEFKDTSGFEVVVDSMLLKQGQLVFTIENEYPYEIVLNANFRAFTDSNGDTLILNYLVPAAAVNETVVRSQVVDLTGYQLNMTEDANGDPAENKMPIDLSLRIQFINGVASAPGDEVRLSGALANIDFKEFYGYLGNTPLEIEKDTILIDFFRSFQEFAKEDLFISNPSLNVTVFNSFSVPIDFDFLYLDAINKNRTPSVLGFILPDSLKPLMVNSPIKYGREMTNVQLNRDNSNIDEILSHLIQEIAFDSRAQFNPNGVP
ncbi:MAG: hypothetical protein JKY48_13260, partial [Flavobacteriales bacterium]|nr:hypothetical protein [Flavobacteriales bacterium]